MTDAELVEQTLAGQTVAYEELVRRWAGRITALCHTRIGCAAAADDVAQEALLRGYRMLGSLAQPDKFGAWLSRIAIHGSINWLRAKERTQVPFSALAPDCNPEDFLCNPSDWDEADHEEDLARLKTEVDRLPEPYRQVLKLYYHQDATYRDLATLLGVSPATINARLTKARNLLRERLSNCRR